MATECKDYSWFRNSLTHSPALGGYSGKISTYMPCPLPFWVTAKGCSWRENTRFHGPLVWASVLCSKADKSLVSTFSDPCSRCSRPLKIPGRFLDLYIYQGDVIPGVTERITKGSCSGCSKSLANRRCFWENIRSQVDVFWQNFSSSGNV